MDVFVCMRVREKYKVKEHHYKKAGVYFCFLFNVNYLPSKNCKNISYQYFVAILNLISISITLLVQHAILKKVTQKLVRKNEMNQLKVFKIIHN